MESNGSEDPDLLGPRALIVDDEPAVLAVYARCLRGKGYRVELAGDGPDAMAALEKQEFDVVVSDITMPKMSGLELVARMNSKGIDVPVVLMTGNPLLESATTAIASGVSRYLTKPVRPDQFVEAVEDVVRRHGIARVKKLALDNEALRTLIAELSRTRDAALAGVRAKTLFISKIGHEVRTPMTSIIGLTEQALQSASDPEQKECLEHVKVAAHDLMHVLSNVLDLADLQARKIALAREKFSIGDVVTAAIEEHRAAAAARSLTIRSEIAQGAETALLGDPSRLRQVLSCVIDNAVKFTPSGGVVIAVDIDERRTPVVARFSIADTGIGIPPESIRRVLDAFVQHDDSATREYGGAGLGLTIAAALVNVMGGELSLASTPGSGTKINFELSFDRDDPEEDFFIKAAFPAAS